LGIDSPLGVPILNLTDRSVKFSIMGSDKRAALLEAASALVSAGDGSAGVDDIAARAGVSKATLYRYFPSKQALLDALAAETGVTAADQDAGDRRTQIVQAALRLIARQGLRATTVEQIAEAAGISPATVFWHFKKRDDLITAVADYCSPLDIFRRSLAAGGEGDPEEDLLQLMRAMLEHAAGRFEVVVTCIAEGWGSPRVAAHFVRTIAAPAWSLFGGYFDAQVAAGRFTRAPFVPRLLTLAGPMWAYFLARRGLSGLLDSASRAEGAAVSDRGSLNLGARGPGIDPLALMLSFAGGASGTRPETADALSPEEMAQTHVATFLAGNATETYRRELKRRRQRHAREADSDKEREESR
jgi:AcrR family transcriptional regulator